MLVASVKFEIKTFFYFFSFIKFMDYFSSKLTLYIILLEEFSLPLRRPYVMDNLLNVFVF